MEDGDRPEPVQPTGEREEELHAAIIAECNARGWFAEDLFYRFAAIGSAGLELRAS